MVFSFGVKLITLLYLKGAEADSEGLPLNAPCDDVGLKCAEGLVCSPSRSTHFLGQRYSPAVPQYLEYDTTHAGVAGKRSKLCDATGAFGCTESICQYRVSLKTVGLILRKLQRPPAPFINGKRVVPRIGDKELEITIHSGSNIANADAYEIFGNLSDPYVKITIGDQIKTTPAVRDSRNPVFNTRFLVPVSSDHDLVHVEVYDQDLRIKGYDDLIGSAVPFRVDAIPTDGGLPHRISILRAVLNPFHVITSGRLDISWEWVKHR